MKRTIIALVLISAAAGAVTALPALGYSSASGLMLGGFFLFPLESSPGSQFTIDTYYGTAGVIKFQPGLFMVLDNGVLGSTLEYRKVLEKDWYGWGNNTDADSAVTMDFEKRNFVADFTFPALDNFYITAGLDVRQSTVFNREEGPLWDQLPGSVFASTWTAGLKCRVNFAAQAPLDGQLILGAEGFFQAGDVSYSGVTETAGVTVEPWNNGTVSAGARLHHQFGMENTPVPYYSGIGQNVNFRGYSDYRFTGPVWTLYQLEIKNRLITLHNFEGEHLLTISAAVFAEAGETAESWSRLSTGDLHTDIGAGVRFMLQPNAEMRIDAAWGDEGMMIQSGFDQPF